LTIVQALREKPLRITALEIFFNFHPSVIHIKVVTKRQVMETYSEGNTLKFFTGTIRCLVTSLTHRPLLILNPSVPSDRNLGER
jgi:hypothetical protein